MPGTTIRERTAQVARSLPTSTGTLFLAGPSEKGSNSIVHNLDDFINKFGSRVSYSLAYDMVEAFFRTGGRLLHFSRILGVTPVVADLDLLDADDDVALTIRARSAGAWANAFNAAVIEGDTEDEFKIVLTHDTDEDYEETSPSFATQAEALQWFESHDDFELVEGESEANPDVAAAAGLTGGTDDIGTVSDATALLALNKFSKKLGPGQVAFAGRTSIAAKGQLADHAAANNRVALWDTSDTAVKATFLAEGAEVNDLANARYGALFGPWLNIPALTGGGSLRAIPASAVVAGVIANNDVNHSANEPAAGENGLVPWVRSLRATFEDDDADDINEGSVNLIREISNDFRVYGYRSGVTKSQNRDWWQFGNVRLYMEIAAKADNILERFVLKQIDGRRIIFSNLENRLTEMLAPYHTSGALHGDDPGEAFYVDTGDTVNTEGEDGTIANGEIRAVIELVMSPMGENVILDIVKKRIGS